MELNEATRKRARATTSSLSGDQDRLSALPDCLLHVIMSFMKARQAVQTCVLSSRWRHLWRSLPCLDIDLDEFKLPAAPALTDDDDDEEEREGGEKDEEYYDYIREEWERFEDLAVNLMLHCNIAALDSFRLSLGSPRLCWCSSKQAGGWIRRAIKYCTPDPGICQGGLSSGSWRLRKLHLNRVLVDGVFAKHVNSMCHSLEDLELEDCTCEIDSITCRSLKNLVLKRCRLRQLSEISSPSLKTLVIDGGSNSYNVQLVICAPAVAHLHLAVSVNQFYGGISVDEMPSIVKASVDIHSYDGVSALKSKLMCNQPKLLRSVSNVTSLELCDLSMMVPGEFQEFKNLRTLLLERCNITESLHTLELILQKAPNLEEITLRHCLVSAYSKKKNETSRAKDACRTLDFQCENLKLIEIIYKFDVACQMLVELLMSISENLPKNCIKLTKVN